MRKIILLSHCILNPYSKVKSNEKTENMLPLIEFLINNDIGIFQLPCPENLIYGQRRWGHVFEQFDTPFYRKTMVKELEPIFLELEDYVKNSTKIIAYIGIDGSPSCGVNFTCSNPKWGGEIGCLYPKDEPLTCGVAKRPGVYSLEISKLIESKGLNIPMLAFEKNRQEELIKELEQLI